MKAKKLLAILLTICMMVSVFPAAFAADDALSFANASKTELTPKLDGKDIKVTKYEAVYCANSNSAEQKLALFVPENATADSPIIYMVDNSGWRSDAYADVQNKVASFGTEIQQLPPFMGGGTQEVEVGNYVSGSDTDAIGECLANGYVILVAGLRSRADGLTGEEYLGHSPATMVDAKAVIRYIKYNADALPAGDADKIVITGTSGGGALSVVTAGSGNSEDYYAGLYEIGAAGISKAADGSYVDTLSDDIYATIAYCPITDLGNACAAYEWQWAEAREQVIADDKVPAGGFGAPVYPEKDVRAEVTAILTANYEEYLDSLGLEAVSAKNLEATIIALIEAEIAEAVKEVAIEQMKKDLDGADWLVINDDGSFEYNYEKHLYWVGTQTAFKAPSAFSNVGMTAWAGNMNEDDLFGTRSDAYSPFNEYAWNNDDTANKVGKDDTGLTWDEYLATDAGKYLQLQTKMTSPIEYLLDAEDGDSAPYWYVRYGLADRDSSFAVEAVLNAALEADTSIKDVNFEYAWLEGHGGDYDGTNDRVGVALKEGYVVVSYGCRSRTDPVVGHSPATMTDTKAVIRYLRANEDVLVGDTDKIVITGTSGGGALSVIISASGNSADYYPSLYEVGAAGITKNADGSYTSTIRDDVWATIAYCPITDLGNACAAYEWTWGAARQQLMNAGALSYKGANKEEVFANSEALVALYEEYINGLGLESVSAANLKNTIIDLMKAEIDETIKEIGIEKMKEDLGDATWLKFNEDGSYTYDYDAHCVWVAEQTALKIAPAFSNVGTDYGEFMNEDNLFGTPDDVYSPFNEYSWGLDKTENAVGQDDTGLTWDEYMATEDGKRLALQIKMTNPIPYLLDEKDGDSAPYWYVRYGMADRDSSFAVEAVLNAAMDADRSIEDKSFEFAWLKPHSGNYDVPEAYAWLADKLDAEAETGYADVAEGAWYADAVKFVSDAGYMNGVSATEFAPKATITRAMLATILYRMAGEPATEKAAEFKDVPAGQWYSDAIAWAAAEEIVKGYGDGLFGTNEAVTREQFVTMLYRYAQFKGEAKGEGADIAKFTDAKSISAWAAEAVAWATEEGIIQGNPDGSFNPKGTASRAEAAVMFQRF